jgi:hypothetical protein
MVQRQQNLKAPRNASRLIARVIWRIRPAMKPHRIIAAICICR